MKKVIGMLAVVALVSSVASAELLKNFKYDGKIEVNAYNMSNAADFNKNADDNTGFVDTRVMLNAGFDLNEDVNAVVSAVKNNRQYGTASENISDGVGSGGVLDNFFFEQAYLNLKGVFGIDHKLGRQYYGEAGDMIIYYGPRMWPYTSPISITAIDGWTGWYKTGNWDFNAIIAKQEQGAVPGSVVGVNDINISGIHAMTTIADVNLTGYVYTKDNQSAASNKSDYLDVLGIKGKYAIPMVKNLNVALEYAMNMGKNTNATTDNEHQGYGYKANVDYSMDLMGKLGIEGEYIYASGDKSTTGKADKAFHVINPDYRPGIIYGGGYTALITAVDADGGVSYNVGANWTPEKMEKLNVAAKYYDFAADNKANTFTGDKHIGSEFDLVATWMHSDNVNVKGYYAMFSPEKKNFVTHDSLTMMGAAFCVKF